MATIPTPARDPRTDNAVLIAEARDVARRERQAGNLIAANYLDLIAAALAKAEAAAESMERFAGALQVALRANAYRSGRSAAEVDAVIAQARIHWTAPVRDVVVVRRKHGRSGDADAGRR